MILIHIGTSGDKSRTLPAATTRGDLPAASAAFISLPRVFSQSVNFPATILPMIGSFGRKRASSAARISRWVAAAIAARRWAVSALPMVAWVLAERVWKASRNSPGFKRALSASRTTAAWRSWSGVDLGFWSVLMLCSACIDLSMRRKLSQSGVFWKLPVAVAVTSARVMTPMVFCASARPWANPMKLALTICALPKKRLTKRGRAFWKRK